MDRQFPRSVYSVALMCAAAADRGLSAADCLAQSGIQPAALTDPGSEVLPEQEIKVIGNIARHLSDQPCIGLELGARFHISVYGVLAFALSSCGTFRELLKLAEQYRQLAFSLTDKRYEQAGPEFRLVFDDTHIPEALRAIAVDRDLSAFINISMELFSQRLPFMRLLLRQPPPASVEPYVQRFGVVPEFGAALNMVIVDARALDLPLPQANPQALRYWDAQLQALLSAKQARTGISGKVRKLLSRGPGEVPDMELIAAELCTTSRHLRRLLTAEGTSFRALVDEYRETMAEQLLTTGRLTVEQVADRLGYDEVSSFSTAFKRWKGVPPREWRLSNQSSHALPAYMAVA